MWLLTQRLTRSRSLKACAESTTSRGVDDFVLHSGSYSAQNSTQPIGARAVSPVEINSGRSCAVLPIGAASNASATAPAATPRLMRDFAREFIVTPSRLAGV